MCYVDVAIAVTTGKGLFLKILGKNAPAILHELSDFVSQFIQTESSKSQMMYCRYDLYRKDGTIIQIRGLLIRERGRELYPALRDWGIDAYSWD